MLTYIYVYVYVNVQYQRKQAEYYKRIPKPTYKANENPLRGTNAQTDKRTNGQKIESGNRADAMTKTYQIHCGKTPARNDGSPLAKNDE